jgi:hypothetical protein
MAGNRLLTKSDYVHNDYASFPPSFLSLPKILSKFYNNYLLTYDSYVPLYNRFHRGEWITRVSAGEGALYTPGPLNGTSEASAIWAQECPGPPPPHSPK